MSFEDDMIEDGFQDEQDYLDYLSEDADLRRERINRSVHDFDDYYKKPFRPTVDERTLLGLMVKCSDGGFAPVYKISKRQLNIPLKAGHFVAGPRFDYIDYDNAIIIPDQYEQVDYFKEGIARCYKGGRWVLINEACEELPLNEKDSVVSTLNCGGKRLYLVERRHRTGSFEHGLLDENGHVLLPTIFKLIQVKSDRLEVEYDRNTFSAPAIKYFTYDQLLSIVKRPSGYVDWDKDSWPEEIIPFVDGVRAIRRNEKWGFEKENGDMLVDCKFTAVQYFREYHDHRLIYSEEYNPRSRMLAIVENDRCSGCIDMSGEIVFHLRKYVRLNSSKQKYLSKTGNYLWAKYYNYDNRNDLINLIESGYEIAMVQVDGSMNIRGTNVPERYDWGLDSGDFIDVIKDGFWGIIDKNGKEIIPCRYDELLFDYSLDDYINNRLHILKKNGKYGKVNNKGEEVIPFIYNDIDSLPEE